MVTRTSSEETQDVGSAANLWLRRNAPVRGVLVELER